MTTFASNYSMAQPRGSTETDRRHLLSPSLAPSAASSIYDQASTIDGDRTPRAHSPAPTHSTEPTTTAPPPRRDTIAASTLTPSTTQPYRGFPSEAAYLEALHEWAEEKRYVEFSMPLVGFYGARTLEEYAERSAGGKSGLRQKLRDIKERRSSKAESGKGRRNTVN